MNTENIPSEHDNSSPSPSSSLNILLNENQQQYGNLLIESNRLSTFKNWPNPNISPQSLAKAGFYYLNRSDQVKCVWCQGVIAKWEKQDDAFEEHKRFFPTCPRVQYGPLIEMANEGMRDLGIQQISPAKKPKFASLDARLRTYINWPISDIQRPEALAQAGLYYQNVDDHVRCFHCNIGLRSWQKEDDPWFEHAKWYPQCQFVRLVKGAQYIQQAQESISTSTQAQHDSISPLMSIDEAMTTQPVLHALEIGIDGGSIRNATLRQLMATGRPYNTVEDLLKAVFGDSEDEEHTREYNTDTENEGAGAAILREMSRLINNIIGGAESSDMVSNVTLNVEDITSCHTAIPSPQTTDSTSSHIIEAAVADCNESVNKASTAVSLKRTESPARCLSLEEENRKLKDARLCKVCLDEEVGVVFLPCGHLVTCVQCAPSVNQCPMCRTCIKGFVRTYLS